ncbi:MAG TPA: Smr/MutS family protein [Bacteroidales bacterium]|nr:Smr/MutS family protein [Bacteroidales bacterium]
MVYPENFETKIGFDRIRTMIAERCVSPMGQKSVEGIHFMTDAASVEQELSKTSEFQYILKFEENFPSENYFDISPTLDKIKIEGTFPETGEVFNLRRSLETLKSVINFFKARKDGNFPALKKMCGEIKVYPYISDAIDRIIDRYGNIKDSASPRLKEIRSELGSKSQGVARKLNSILKQAQADGIVDPDASVSIRNGRGVIPVNVFDKRKIKGLIHDQSASGKTVFIEPSEIVEINNEIIELEYEERREIVKILTTFADNIRPYSEDLRSSNSFLGEIDFIRAKALLGNWLGSIKPSIAGYPVISWRKAVHPILFASFAKTPRRKVVPLDISLGAGERILLISGPNAGGKSVCLKTVGLLQYMLQCGLTIPVQEGSECGLFGNIFIDIGDEQSIDNDLSTYSSHLLSMKYFLKHSDTATMVLIDEFGTGTEPLLGGAIAETILDQLNKHGVFGVMTTHYTNLKHFASVTPGITNGAMAFDNHLMQPLFQLFIGKPGSSFAFEIARKIGLPEDLLSEASEKAGTKNINYDRHLKDIARDKRYWENKRQNIRQYEKKLEDLIGEYEKEVDDAKKVRKEIVAKAKEDARYILESSNKIIENAVREIKESQAEKERTREARQRIEEFKSEVMSDAVAGQTDAEKKAEVLKTRAKKFRSSEKPEEKNAVHQPEKPPGKGDAVRMIDTQAAGEVVEVRDGLVTVETGSFRFRVPADKVERISRGELKKALSAGRSRISIDSEINSRKISFKPEIDIRGVRGDEAIQRVQELLDDALMVQHRDLRILHGKGNGILRELIRKYLGTIGFVRSYRDEHVEMGGSGITVVELDI